MSTWKISNEVGAVLKTLFRWKIPTQKNWLGSHPSSQNRDILDYEKCFNKIHLDGRPEYSSFAKLADSKINSIAYQASPSHNYYKLSSTKVTVHIGASVSSSKTVTLHQRVLCAQNINRNTWLSDSSDDITFNISVTGLNLIASKGHGQSIL